MPGLEESSARRPDWQPGVPLQMGDGQVWHFRRPKLRYCVAIGPDGSPVATRYAPEHGMSYLEASEKLRSCDGDGAAIGLIATLTLTLLRLNYDVPDPAVPGLYQYDADDPESVKLWGELHNLALGIVPDPPSPIG